MMSAKSMPITHSGAGASASDTRVPWSKSLRAWWLPLFLLLVSTAGLWGIFFYRFTSSSWGVPVAYSVDSINQLAIIHAASQGHYLPFCWKTVPELGAPIGANWNDMPATEDFHYAFFGAMARIIGLIPAANLALLLAFLLSSVSFYWACRLLHYRALWSAVGALLYSFSHYAFFRGLAHLELTYYGHLPLALVVIWRLGAGTWRSLSDKGAWLALAVAAWSGLQNAYYTNILAQFVLFALLANVAGGKTDPGRWRAAAFCVAILIVMMGAFVVGNIDTLTYGWLHGKNPLAIERNYAGVEIYSLKPMELFLPGPFHRLRALRPLAKYYFELSAIIRLERGEIFAAYLGVIGTLSLIWFVAFGFAQASRQGARAKLPLGAWQMLWVIVFSTMGGINCLLALCGLELFRAANRYSIVLLTILLIFLVRMLSAATRRWHLSAQVALGALLLTIGLYDQNFVSSPISGLNSIRAKVDSDRSFASDMERRLTRNAAIFQLPVALYPEQKPIGQMTDYEQFRPYLYTQNLRFSYGDTKGRDHERWQLEIEDQLRTAITQTPPALTPIITALQAKGFSAFSIDRNGYSDRADAMINACRQAGLPMIAEAKNGDFIAFQLVGYRAASNKSVLLNPLFAHAD